MLDIKLKIKPGHTSDREWMMPSSLKTLFWNVTHACNYRCPVCFSDSGAATPGELSTEEAFEAVDKIHSAGVHDVLISGGEPFIRRDMVRILERMGDLGIAARIASNGSLLTNEILDRLKRSTLTRSFQISLDTTDTGLYSRIHGNRGLTYQDILAALRRIREHGFHTTVSVRLTPKTISGIPQLLDTAVAENWATVTVHIPLHTKRAEGAFPQDADFFALLRPAFSHFCALPEKWLVETYIPWAEYHPAVRWLAKEVKVVNRGCRAGRDRLTINPTGTISPCVCLDVPEAHLGNIRKDPLQDVFRNSALCDMMRHPAEYGICEDCPNLEKCGGGCRVAAFALSGRLDGLDRSCPVRKQLEERRVQG